MLVSFTALTDWSADAWIATSPLSAGTTRRYPSASTQRFSTRIAVPASELDADLTKEERDVVSVVRSAAPSVAYVTSVLPFDDSLYEGRGRRKQQRRRPQSNGRTSSRKNETETDLPRGQSLGSGSGFVIDSQGYLVTNYHVVERAYQIQSTAETVDKMTHELIGNFSELSGLSLETLNNALQRFSAPYRQMPLPEVFVRISSSTRYRECRIVDVKPDLDIAVLKIVNMTSDDNTIKTIHFGSSSELLVGQTLVAIGNPFGLDSSVTTGVVSALNRDLQTVGGRSRMSNPTPLRNCIQTDASINPGNR